MGEAGCQRDKGSPSRCQRDRGVWGPVWPATYVFFYMHLCVRSVYVCPLGIHTQPCSWLDLGAWSCGSPASTGLSDLDRFPPTCKHQVGCYIPACLHRTAQSTACQPWRMACREMMSESAFSPGSCRQSFTSGSPGQWRVHRGCL